MFNLCLDRKFFGDQALFPSEVVGGLWLAVAEATRGSSFEPQSPAVVSKTWFHKWFLLCRCSLITTLISLLLTPSFSFLPSFKRHFYNSDEWRKCRAVEDSDFRDINFSEVEHSWLPLLCCRAFSADFIYFVWGIDRQELLAGCTVSQALRFPILSLCQTCQQCRRPIVS